MSGTWQVYALRYATRAARRSEHFIGGDPHDAPMPMDYFVWAIVPPAGPAIVLDTGFTAEVAARRKRDYLRCPVEGLRLLGIESGSDVVVVQVRHHHVLDGA